MLDTLYILRNILNEKHIFFCFCGPLSNDLVVELGDTVKSKMKLEDVSQTTIIRAFSLIVENVQNIMFYSADITRSLHTDAEKNIRSGIVAIGYDNDRFFILSGNLIKHEEVEHIKSKLTTVQHMDKDQLRMYYRQKRKQSPEKGSKGAGLGFIEMAKKSKDKIEFLFTKVDDKHTFFSLKTTI